MIYRFGEIVKLAGNHKRAFADIDRGKWYFNLRVTNLLQMILPEVVVKQ